MRVRSLFYTYLKPLDAHSPNFSTKDTPLFLTPATRANRCGHGRHTHTAQERAGSSWPGSFSGRDAVSARCFLRWSCSSGARKAPARASLPSVATSFCQRARQEEEHRINDSRECGLRHHQVNQDQGWRRQEFKKVHLPAEISTPFYSHGSDMSIEVVVKLSPSGSRCSVYCRRRHCTCAKRPRVSGVRLGKPGPVTRSRSIGGFFSCGWRAQSGRRLASQDLCASRKMLRFFAT